MAEPLKLNKQARTFFREIGGTGLNIQQGTFLQEEYQRELRGLEGVKIYTEMMNSAVVGAILFVIEQMITQVEWKIEPFSDENKDQAAKDFIQECLDDLNGPFTDTLSEICTMFPYGWAFLEVVYKMRKGDNGKIESKFTDGKIGWHKWALRGQNTLAGWDLDENGATQGMIQQLVWPRAERVTIPIEKALLFRTRVERENPEGRSILRSAYSSWWYAKRFMEIEAIAIERDLAGLPVLTPPEGLDLWNPNDTDMVSALTAAQKMIQSIRRGEKEGVLLPFGWVLTLLTSGSRRTFDLNQTITRYETRITQSMLADFIFLGQGRTGSWALSSDKTELFVLALGGYLRRIKDVINRHAIPTLLELNKMDKSRPPKIEHGDIETQNLAELAQYLTALSGIGAIMFPDEKLERHLRLVADLPDPPEREEGLPVPPNAVEPPTARTPEVKETIKRLMELRELMKGSNALEKHRPGGQDHDQSAHGHRGGGLVEPLEEKGGFTYNPLRMRDREAELFGVQKAGGEGHWVTINGHPVFLPGGKAKEKQPGEMSREAAQARFGRQSQTVYHGTLPERAREIIREGLRTGEYNNYNFVPDREKKVFVTLSPEVAKNFGIEVALSNSQENFAVVEAVIPPNVSLEKDTRLLPARESYTLDKVESSWIKSVKFYQLEKNAGGHLTGDIKLVDEIKKQGRTIYIPVGLDAAKSIVVRKAGGDESEGHWVTIHGHPVFIGGPREEQANGERVSESLTGGESLRTTGEKVYAVIKPEMAKFKEHLGSAMVEGEATKLESMYGDYASAASDFMGDKMTDDQLAAYNELTAKLNEGVIEQVMASNERTLNDHGIHHLQDDIQSYNQILDSIAKETGEPVSNEERLLGAVMGLYHDIGYTDPTIRAEPAEHGAHPKIAAERFKDEGIGELLGRMGVSAGAIEQAANTIGTHADITFDWSAGGRMTSAFQIADAISVFAEEKVPEVFRAVPNGMTLLGRAYRIAQGGGPDASKEFETVRATLRTEIKNSDLSTSATRMLLKATDEMTLRSPKFILGTWAGDSKTIGYSKEDGLIVTVHASERARVINRLFDHPVNVQFGKLVKDFSGGTLPQDRTTATITKGGKAVMTLRLTGEVGKHEAVGKHRPGGVDHDQRERGQNFR